MFTPLEDEARRTARWREGARWTQLLASASAVFSWSQHHEPRLIFAALGGVLGSLMAHVSAKKWKARAEWYKTHENWHEQLDKLPDVRSFPRIYDWFDSWSNNRQVLRRILYTVATLLAIEVAWVIWKSLA